MSGLNSSLASNAVKTALDLVFMAEFNGQSAPGHATAEDASVFNQDSIDRAAVITEQFQGPGYFDERSELGDVASATLRVGNSKTFTVTNWAKSVDISKNFFDDDQHSVVEKMIKSMSRNGRLTRDKNAFNIYNLAFTTALANDGVAIVSDSHITLDGTTVDNKLTGVLNDANLNTAFVQLQTQKTQDGTLGGHIPYCLLVPPVLFKTAQEITKSELRSGTSNNDLNYYSQLYPGLMVKTSPFLDATFGGSNTAWFLLSKDHSMTRWVREAINTDMVDYKFQRNNNYIYKAEYREVTGCVSFEGLVGSTGAAA